MQLKSCPQQRRRPSRRWLRSTLRYSQAEAVASATTTATGDNFFNAFAVLLHATTMQMSWLTAFPQLLGAAAQLFSVWLGTYVARRPLVIVAALLQALAVLGIAALGWFEVAGAMPLLIALAVGYHALANVIQPQWRAWMGSLVPARRRGVFFASRTRLHMVTALAVFLGGGWLLAAAADRGHAAMGFGVLFGIAALGRLISTGFYFRMVDPDPQPPAPQTSVLVETFRQMRGALADRAFRNYSLFVAGMGGMVAISAPFFAVYMLRDLEFTYWQFSLNSVASIVVQFICLRQWGRISDRYGNHFVLLVTALMIPTLPFLWLVSPNFYYLLLVQAFSGLAWSGFSLSSANYLYDIRPHRTNFATYAAVQACMGAVLVCLGALGGGLLAEAAPAIQAALPFDLESHIFVVFIASGSLRLLVTLWFLPRAEEPHLRHRPALLQLVLRISRYTPVSGLVLDWMTVTKKERAPEN